MRLTRPLVSFLALGAALALARGASSQDAKPDAKATKAFLWHVTTEKGSVYLLGSIHIAPPELYPLAKEIETAYAASKFLVVECDVEKGSPEEMQKIVMEKGMYGENDALSKHVARETLASLTKTATDLGIDIATLEKMKPWMVAVQLSALRMQNLGLDPSKGIDKHFLKKAKKPGKEKEVLELESVEEQLGLFAGFSDEQQEKFLVSTLGEVDGMKEQMDALFTAWKDGDAKKMEAATFGELKKKPELKLVFEKMFDERNVKMVAKIEGYLKDKGPHFVVVGAGHLVGPKGLLQLLTDKKYKVEQVATKAESK
jgi:uncharacterized protein YbaP (TraB family)